MQSLKDYRSCDAFHVDEVVSADHVIAFDDGCKLRLRNNASPFEQHELVEARILKSRLLIRWRMRSTTVELSCKSPSAQRVDELTVRHSAAGRDRRGEKGVAESWVER